MRYALLSVLILGNGCSFMQARSDFREEKRMRTSLMEGAEAYWESMRWSDIASAAGYYQDPQVRVNWLTYMGSGGATQFRSATILRIELGPELEEHERGWRREALALVQVESYTMPAQMLTQQVMQQQWYLLDRTWYPTPDPQFRDW